MNSPVDLSLGHPGTIFLSGIYLATMTASGLFFLRFWRKTKERFFLLFALACWMLAFERLPLLLVDPTSEPYSLWYLCRLVAFYLIFQAVSRANVARRDR